MVIVFSIIIGLVIAVISISATLYLVIAYEKFIDKELENKKNKNDEESEVNDYGTDFED